MKLTQLKELIKQVVKEENDYQEMFKALLDKTGKSLASMNDTEKKAFFNAVDKAAKAKSEGKLRGYNEGEGGYTADTSGMESDVDGQVSSEFSKALSSVGELTDKQKQIDVDKDGEIEGSDLAKLRAKNERAQKKK
jgi:hypothetical protein